MLNPEFRPFLGLLALAKPFPDTLAAPHHAELYGTSRRRVLRPKSGREGEAVEVPVPMFCGCVGRWILVEEGALILSGQEKKGIRRRAGRLARELGKKLDGRKLFLQKPPSGSCRGATWEWYGGIMQACQVFVVSHQQIDHMGLLV